MTERVEAKEYKFLAECLLDAVEAIGLLCRGQIVESWRINSRRLEDSYLIPEVLVMVKSRSDLDELRTCIAKVIDGHVMLGTLAPSETFAGYREHDIEKAFKTSSPYRWLVQYDQESATIDDSRIDQLN